MAIQWRRTLGAMLVAIQWIQWPHVWICNGLASRIEPGGTTIAVQITPTMPVVITARRDEVVDRRGTAQIALCRASIVPRGWMARGWASVLPGWGNTEISR